MTRRSPVVRKMAEVFMCRVDLLRRIHINNDNLYSHKNV